MRQASDRLTLGPAYRASGYVAVDEEGQPSPNTLSFRWGRMLKLAGVQHIRLHDAGTRAGRACTSTTVPIAIIAAYTHSPPGALANAAMAVSKAMSRGENR